MKKGLAGLVLLVFSMILFSGCQQIPSKEDQAVEKAFIEARNGIVGELNKESVQDEENVYDAFYQKPITEDDIIKMFVDQDTGIYYFIYFDEVYKDPEYKQYLRKSKEYDKFVAEDNDYISSDEKAFKYDKSKGNFKLLIGKK